MPQPTESSDSLPIHLKRILFTSDFTETSAMALPYAAAFARRFVAEIFAIHVIPADEYQHIHRTELDEVLEQLKHEAGKRIKELLAAAGFAEIPYSILFDHGDVMEAIAANVREHQIDLIVAGSHGRQGIKKLLYPSTAEAIARGLNVRFY